MEEPGGLQSVGVAETRTRLSDLTLSSRCSGTTQRDRAGREMGGEFRTWWGGGNACMLLADSRRCMQKPSRDCNYPP